MKARQRPRRAPAGLSEGLRRPPAQVLDLRHAAEDFAEQCRGHSTHADRLTVPTEFFFTSAHDLLAYFVHIIFLVCCFTQSSRRPQRLKFRSIARYQYTTARSSSTLQLGRGRRFLCAAVGQGRGWTDDGWGHQGHRSTAPDRMHSRFFTACCRGFRGRHCLVLEYRCSERSTLAHVSCSTPLRFLS